MKTKKSPSIILLGILILFVLIIIFSAAAQTNAPDTNSPATNAPAIVSKVTPQSAAYTFKEWMGVIGSVLAAVYAAVHVVFMAVVHYGGMRKIIADFVGKWPDGFQFFAPKPPAPVAAGISAPVIPSAPPAISEQK